MPPARTVDAFGACHLTRLRRGDGGGGGVAARVAVNARVRVDDLRDWARAAGACREVPAPAPRRAFLREGRAEEHAVPAAGVVGEPGAPCALAGAVGALVALGVVGPPVVRQVLPVCGLADPLPFRGITRYNAA